MRTFQSEANYTDKKVNVEELSRILCDWSAEDDYSSVGPDPTSSITFNPWVEASAVDCIPVIMLISSNWLIVCFFVPLRIFHTYWDVTIASEWLQL
jgi:hypothetical protein